MPKSFEERRGKVDAHSRLLTLPLYLLPLAVLNLFGMLGAAPTRLRGPRIPPSEEDVMSAVQSARSSGQSLGGRNV